MALEPLSTPVLPTAPVSGSLVGWARNLVRVGTATLDRLVRRVNQAVFVADNQTIAGEKTFTNVLRVFNTLAGPRRNVLTRGSGSTQPAAADSWAWITTDGALTIPASTGANYFIELAGDHDITVTGIGTVDVSAKSWASGDILRLQIKSSSSARIWREAAAADLGTFA